jgi:hypothetical protein
VVVVVAVEVAVMVPVAVEVAVMAPVAVMALMEVAVALRAVVAAPSVAATAPLRSPARDPTCRGRQTSSR